MVLAIDKKNEASKFGSNVFKLVSGKVIAQAIILIVMPIITRMYSPSDFGVLQVFISLTAVIIVISALRYDLAIMLPKKDEEAVNIVALSTVIVGFTSILSLVIVAVFKHSIVGVLGVPELGFYLWFAPLVIFTGGLLHVFRYWSSRRQQFGTVALSGVSTNISNSAVMLTVGIIDRAGPGGLIGANIAGSMIGTLVLAGRSFIQDWTIFRENVSLNNIKYWAQRYKNFPIYSSWSGFLTNANMQLPALMLAYFFSPTIVGFYALGYRAITIPLNLISEAVGRVFFQKASEEKSNNGHTAAVVEAVFKRLVFIGFFPMLVLTIVGKDLFVFVFGSNWSEAGYYMQFFAPWLFFVFLSSPISTIFIVLEKQKTALLLNIFKFTITFFALLIGGIIGESRFAIILFSISSMFLRFFLLYFSLKISSVSFSKGLKYIWTAFIFSVPFIVLITVSNILSMHIVMVLLLTFIGGLIYYIFVVKNDVFIKNYALDLKNRLLS